tara:strand:+ start:315 stop:458 length:144 start_codon:yes stop_codon:yes gene_type:complete
MLVENAPKQNLSSKIIISIERNKTKFLAVTALVVKSFNAFLSIYKYH